MRRQPRSERLPPIIAVVTALALALPAGLGCGSGDGGGGQLESRSPTPALGATGPSGPTGSDQLAEQPAVGERVPKKPPKPAKSRSTQPTVVIAGGRCAPRSLKVPARSSLAVRNRDAESARFQVPANRIDLPVPRRELVHVLLAPGTHRFVCRIGSDQTTSGKVTVARPTG